MVWRGMFGWWRGVLGWPGGGPTPYTRLVRTLACFLLAAIIVQLSGVLVLYHRYSVPHLYDVMLLVTNTSSDDAIQTHSHERHTIRPVPHRFIARYLLPTKAPSRALQTITNSSRSIPSKHFPFSQSHGKSNRHINDRSLLSNALANRVPKSHRPIPPYASQLLAERTTGQGPSTKQPTKDHHKGGNYLKPIWELVDTIRHGLHAVTTFLPVTQLKPCTLNKTELEGPLSVIFTAPEWGDLERRHPEVKPGGHWVPPYCIPQHKVAVVVPFRDRDQHLRLWLQHIHRFLQRQLLDYTILVIEQAPHTTFNRAMLMNIGFSEGEKMKGRNVKGFGCYIFHDVDLLPESLENVYSCPPLPRHLSSAVDSMGYRLPYDGIFGGASAMKSEHFRLVNGFSNCFFGWGGEDDDMFNRIKHHGLNITRYPLRVGRYRMINHQKQNPSNDRFKMLNTGPLRFETDGLSSLKYKVISNTKKPLYTLIKVDVKKEDVVPKDLLYNFPPALPEHAENKPLPSVNKTRKHNPYLHLPSSDKTELLGFQ